jgi:hypothetical protein
MAKIDEIKEELNYLKVWLGIIVLTTISLISWLVNNYEESGTIRIFADIFGIVVLTVSIKIIDKKIKNKIRKLKDL